MHTQNILLATAFSGSHGHQYFRILHAINVKTVQFRVCFITIYINAEW